MKPLIWGSHLEQWLNRDGYPVTDICNGLQRAVVNLIVDALKGALIFAFLFITVFQIDQGVYFNTGMNLEDSGMLGLCFFLLYAWQAIVVIVSVGIGLNALTEKLFYRTLGECGSIAFAGGMILGLILSVLYLLFYQVTGLTFFPSDAYSDSTVFFFIIGIITESVLVVFGVLVVASESKNFAPDAIVEVYDSFKNNYCIPIEYARKEDKKPNKEDS